MPRLTCSIDSDCWRDASATSEQSAAASEELSSQAGLVRSLVGQFRLRGAAAQAPLDEPAEESDSLTFTDSKY